MSASVTRRIRNTVGGTSHRPGMRGGGKRFHGFSHNEGLGGALRKAQIAKEWMRNMMHLARTQMKGGAQ